MITVLYKHNEFKIEDHFIYDLSRSKAANIRV